MNALTTRLFQKFGERMHQHATRGVLETPPLRAIDDGVVLFSMMGTRVLQPYLVAVKSLHHFLQRGRIVILDDGTLTEDDKAVLRDHLDDPEIRCGLSVDTRNCPTYSSWRRLFTLLDLRRENYVIQLDSDTVTIGDVPQVVDLVDSRTGFSLRGEAGAEFCGLTGFAARARQLITEPTEQLHVQDALEEVMDQVVVPGLDAPSYGRGCAGFAGFAPDPSVSALAEQFSAEASRLIGFERWSQWGSEQVTSNFLIANEPGAQLLPYDHYCNFWNEPISSDMRFVHFIGTYRYRRGLYSELSRRMIDQLGAR